VVVFTGGGGDGGDDPELTFLNALSLPYHYPRQCPYCPRILSHSGNWKKHVATIHGNQERNIPCWMCEGRFRTSEYLQKHLVRVHKVPCSRGRRLNKY